MCVCVCVCVCSDAEMLDRLDFRTYMMACE